MTRRLLLTAALALAAGGFAGCENRPQYANPGGLRASAAASPRAMAADADAPERGRPPADREQYDSVEDNPFVRVAEEPRSTFSLDVDTASYSNVRRLLRDKRDVPPGAVRIEELVNYFPYAYAPPASDAGDPLAIRSDVATCPWAKDHLLVRLAVKATEIEKGERPAMNLVFLLDVSGSMNSPDKLSLVKDAMRLLVGQLREQDTVAVVVYAGASGLAVPPTSGDRQASVMAALDELQAGGSTNGGEGIQLAYKVAADNYKKAGVNRVILCTDGDFNVGVSDRSRLVDLIESKAKTGVYLSVLGFGTGNLRDATMEELSNKGNGNFAYIDTEQEARKTLVAAADGTLVTVAKDVKIQIEFNPKQARAYRLIGYENRVLATRDFNDDQKDAGDVGSGHTVTAFYEVVPPGAAMPTTRPGVDDLKYQSGPEPVAAADSGELMTVKLRYKRPDGEASKLLTQAVPAAEPQQFAAADDDFRFAAGVAAFGMVLRDSPHKGTADLAWVRQTAKSARGNDAGGYRGEFVDLVDLAAKRGGKREDGRDEPASARR